MSLLLADFAPAHRWWLLVTASPREAAAVAAGVSGGAAGELEYWRPTPIGARFDVLLTGVGKANAAGAVARTLDPARHAGVINLGIAGALPSQKEVIRCYAVAHADTGDGMGSDPGRTEPYSIGEVVIGFPSVFADEGVATPQGFVSMDSLGFGPKAGNAANSSGEFMPPLTLVRALLSLGASKAPIATVSVCSGSDDGAQAIVNRTGAVAEAMEGAAVGLAAWYVGGPSFPFAEIRVISNTTGNRARQRWDLDGALARLREIAALL